MKHRMLVYRNSDTASEILGTARISRGGTMYFPKKTKEAIRRCSEQEGDNIDEGAKTLYVALNDSLRITSKRSYDEYTDKLRKTLDVDTRDGRILFRFLTSKSVNYDCEFEKIRLSKQFMAFMRMKFEDGDNSKKRILISHKGKDEDNQEGYYSLINPDNLDRLILLSASLMSTLGQKLIKEAIDLLNLSTADKTIVIIFDRKSESDRDYEKSFVKGCEKLGFASENIILSSDVSDDKELRELIESAGFRYCPDGNIYETLDYIHRRKLAFAINISVTSENKATFIGSSAGAAAAGTDIDLIDYAEFDKNEVGLTEFRGIGLIDGTVIPHYDEDEYLENLKDSAIQDGKEDILEKHKVITRVGNEETLII